MRIFLTGCAGFIGFHAARKLLSEGHSVIGVDNLNDYYDPALKQARLRLLRAQDGFEFHSVDISDQTALNAAVSGKAVTHILHLAAQAGVRYSLENPHSYAQTNLIGHLNMLELARHMEGLEHFVYASSSSVYGERSGGDFREDDINRAPASLYAATKIGGEMLSESYARLYNIAQTGLRFFTVYGITLFAPDEMQRDFTYVDDIVSVFPAILTRPPVPVDGRAHEIYNLGNSSPAKLHDLVAAIEKACGTRAKIEIAPKQAGDVSRTFANIDKAQARFGFAPKMPLEAGIKSCVDWYRSYKDI